MPTLELITRIEAPVERCFDLARDVEAHCRSAAFTAECVLPPGRTAGLLEQGDRVVFEGFHLGVRRRLSARITAMERPTRFVDEMESGDFRRLRHEHTFRAHDGGTLMTDRLDWESPCGPLGRLADLLLMGPHLRRFLARKQANLKRLAEEAR